MEEQERQCEQMVNKKVLVLGLAKTGVSVVNWLTQMGALVTVNDKCPLDQNKAAQDLIEKDVRVITGGHPIELLDEDFAFMVKNPGIPYTNPLVKRALEMGLPVYTDIELVEWLHRGTIVGITGSNGKTTTTSLTGAILKSDKSFAGRTEVAGNIGIPALDIAPQLTSKDRLVLELSSFQLMGTKTFRPNIAAIIDIYPTHLDYHGNLENYIAAKWHITANQGPEDVLFLNYDQEVLWSRRYQTQAKVIPFSLETPLEDGIWYNTSEGKIFWKKEAVMDRADLFLPGDHNVQNALVAIGIAKVLGVSNAVIQETCRQFTGVKHRIQYVQTVNKRKFYNDSKATNNEACMTALKSFNQSLVWIAGGLDRGNSIDELLPYLKNVHAAVVMGETQEKFAQLVKKAGITQLEYAKDIEEATQKAYAMSKEDDIILLSPACASWDQYPNFEVRGDRFIQAISQLENL
ncbi:UDP-N-acetylmuramoyl-L-alanine--D-glutamate ligase [Aerococcus christensenii]|uniref:UDP-N-acetylmuramoyl-L-alanine--D-glutamate ligase n=1 Tax=Aerococcus christensenii TaxID=87541 RepID=UPI0023A921AA|nr:UDP-N-acetylmuramoyl-L-alanine--D-glutamate ligase [Aerococcus christensenii]WEB70508.1 UDP-N-acetylmuramoyl-L-alanine--D-glutamate ligase [Aerococcus christensenii]